MPSKKQIDHGSDLMPRQFPYRTYHYIPKRTSPVKLKPDGTAWPGVEERELTRTTGIRSSPVPFLYLKGTVGIKHAMIANKEDIYAGSKHNTSWTPSSDTSLLNVLHPARMEPTSYKKTSHGYEEEFPVLSEQRKQQLEKEEGIWHKEFQEYNDVHSEVLQKEKIALHKMQTKLLLDQAQSYISRGIEPIAISKYPRISISHMCIHNLEQYINPEFKDAYQEYIERHSLLSIHKHTHKNFNYLEQRVAEQYKIHIPYFTEINGKDFSCSIWVDHTKNVEVFYGGGVVRFICQDVQDMCRILDFLKAKELGAAYEFPEKYKTYQVSDFLRQLAAHDKSQSFNLDKTTFEKVLCSQSEGKKLKSLSLNSLGGERDDNLPPTLLAASHISDLNRTAFRTAIFDEILTEAAIRINDALKKKGEIPKETVKKFLTLLHQYESLVKIYEYAPLAYNAAIQLIKQNYVAYPKSPSITQELFRFAINSCKKEIQGPYQILFQLTKKIAGLYSDHILECNN